MTQKTLKQQFLNYFFLIGLINFKKEEDISINNGNKKDKENNKNEEDDEWITVPRKAPTQNPKESNKKTFASDETTQNLKRTEIENDKTNLRKPDAFEKDKTSLRKPEIIKQPCNEGKIVRPRRVSC